jgi:S1-C subfamily serine protease
MIRNISLYKRIGGLSLLLACQVIMGCQSFSEKNALAILEQSIHQIAEQAEESVIVVELTIIEGLEDKPDSIIVKRRFGSGFALGPPGIVITTEALVKPADSLWIITQSGARIPAEVLSTDFETNVAVLRVEGLELQPFTPVTSDIANGCIGIMVSNTYYSEGMSCILGTINGTWIGGGDFLDHKLLSIHVSWAEANGGTPVLNVKGQLIGMVEGHMENDQSTWTVIPATTIEKVSKQIVAFGSVERGWIGLRSNPVCPVEKTARLMKDWKGQGAVVSSLVYGSPAENAGIQIGDVITLLNNERIFCISDLRKLVTALNSETEIELTINRDGKEMIFKITLSKIPDDLQRQRRSIRRST